MNVNASRLDTTRGIKYISHYESRMIFSLCALLFVPAINNFLNSLFVIGFSIDLPFLTPTSYIFMAVLSVFNLYILIIRRRSFLIFFSVLIAGAVISYIIYPEIRSVIYGSPVDLVYSPLNKLVYFCFPALLGVVCLSDYKVFFEKLVKWGKAVLVLGVLTFIYVYFFAGKVLQYMVYSYFMLLPLCLVFESARTKKSFGDFFLAILGTVCIVMCGARGAIVSLFLYFVTRLVLVDFKRISIKKALEFFGFMVPAGLLLLFFFEETLNFLIKLLDSIGVSSRVITSLVEGTLTNDRGRELILNAVETGLHENPFGYGLYGDRYVVGTFGNEYVYAHNIVLELMCNFGVVFGLSLLCALIWRIAKVAFYLRNREEIRIILAFLPYGLYQLIFSSSMLENIPFFILVGLCFFVNWEKYYKKQNS